MSPHDSELVDKITRLLVEEFAPEQVFLFGSRAWGNPDGDSDWDFLVIVNASDLSPTQRATAAYLRLTEIPVPVDVIVKTRAEVERFRRVHASLVAEILERGKVLYG
jgi:uncharacterized protein